jgi:hypothetical protein
MLALGARFAELMRLRLPDCLRNTHADDYLAPLLAAKESDKIDAEGFTIQ